MAVNLENLLPQALLEPFAVPSNGSDEVSSFGDLFSPSMYGSDNLSSLFVGVADSMTPDPSLMKCDVGNEGVQYVDGGETLYQTNPSDIFNDNWMTTPMSLPLTPDEPTGTTSSLPPITYAIVPAYANHTPSAVPLTPESLVSPGQSSCDGEELDEVLSYFADTSDMTPQQDYSGFPSADMITANYSSSSHIYHDSASSLQSPYTPLSSTPTSPASYAPATPTTYMPATPTAYTPVSSPLSNSSSFPVQSISPSDTICDLLAHDPSLQHTSKQNITPQTSKLTPRGANNPLKRKSGEVETTASKRPATAKGGSRKRVSVSVKKERKREQNKTAALRYRQKKKEEKLECDQQEQILEEKNAELRSTLSGLEAEVNYLKRLWAEVEQAKRNRSQ